MKSAAVIVFVVLVAAVSCYPEKIDLKELKAESARKKACLHDCSSVKLEPVCAGKAGEKPKSFGSECVMNNYNCEHKDIGDGCYVYYPGATENQRYISTRIDGAFNMSW